MRGFERDLGLAGSPTRHTPAHELPRLVREAAARVGAEEATMYLADVQQAVLVPFVERADLELDHSLELLSVDSTLAGRSFQSLETLTQPGDTEHRRRCWIPLASGSERVGVLSVVLPSRPGGAGDHVELSVLAEVVALAEVAARAVVRASAYTDTIERLRRRTEMGLAAEMQWSLLPPLTCVTDRVAVAAALEPAYQVAGDSVDYAVGQSTVQVAVFDGMGHGLLSAQLATLAVAAYRNARRGGRSLVEAARALDHAMAVGSEGASFTTGLMAELDLETGAISWVNAGHPDPLLLRHGRLVRPLHTDPILPFGLGAELFDEEQTVAVGSEMLQPGDRVLLYSDGVVEARSPEGEMFGADRLVDLVGRKLAGALGAAETVRRVVVELLEHQQDQLADDATLLLVEWMPAFEPGGGHP